MSDGLILDLFGFPMGSPIPYRIASELPARAPVTAGTDEPEGVAVETVTADPAVSDPGSAPSDRDRVKHERKDGDGRESLQGDRVLLPCLLRVAEQAQASRGDAQALTPYGRDPLQVWSAGVSAAGERASASMSPRLGDEPGCETASQFPAPPGSMPTVSRSARSAGSEAAEAVRLARLARFQRQP